MKKVKFGVIGVGNIGTHHVNTIPTMGNAELTAVCDINPAAFDRIPAQIREKITCYTDSAEFFAKADVEAVIIAVPHYDHPDLAIQAMKAGKHVIVEKPIAVHKAEAERLICEAKKYPELKKSLMFCQRTLGAHKKIKQMIANGDLGKITRINWIITNWFRSQIYYDSGDWRATWRGEGGGVLLNQCPHQLDLWQWFFGVPSKIRAFVKFGKYHDIEVEDEVNAYMEYDDGAVGNFITSTGEMPGTNRLEITAEKGRLVYENGNIEFLRNEIETSVFCKTTKNAFGVSDLWKCEIPYSEESNNQHMNVINNMAEAILHDTPLLAPLEEGLCSLEIANAILLSGLRDTTIELPIDSADFSGELEKLISTSRYQKKTVAAVNAGDMSASFINKGK